MMTNPEGPASSNPKLLVSKAWIQWAALVVLFGFFVLGLLAYRTYAACPPIPTVVLGEDGAVVFSGEDVTQGQRIFLRASRRAASSRYRSMTCVSSSSFAPA